MYHHIIQSCYKWEPPSVQKIEHTKTHLCGAKSHERIKGKSEMRKAKYKASTKWPENIRKSVCPACHAGLTDWTKYVQDWLPFRCLWSLLRLLCDALRTSLLVGRLLVGSLLQSRHAEDHQRLSNIGRGQATHGGPQPQQTVSSASVLSAKWSVYDLRCMLAADEHSLPECAQVLVVLDRTCVDHIHHLHCTGHSRDHSWA